MMTTQQLPRQGTRKHIQYHHSKAQPAPKREAKLSFKQLLLHRTAKKVQLAPVNDNHTFTAPTFPHPQLPEADRTIPASHTDRIL
jgi:hypothetical protein